MECEFSSRERSGEEDAELQCSTKKVKEDQPCDPQQATLVREISNAYAQVFKFQADEEKEPFSDEEVDNPPKGTMTIKLSKRTKMNIRAKWTHSLIVKVFGRSKPAGRLDSIDLEKEFYLIKFRLVEDYEKVLTGGPRFVGEHFLTIRAWEP
ncbi:hypothetical protein SO802_023820 [Lithocarpus litseifolius]|uniref:DUF4283 domain-containing protein n=1 Tax=Lithocarpus litseifolius TaxID=425828 RepID=A0AAW2C9A0_9ROSI